MAVGRKFLFLLAVLLCSVPWTTAAAKKSVMPWEKPIELTIPEIFSGDYDYKPAFLTGTVLDVIDDTADPEHIFLLIADETDSVLAPVENAKNDYQRLKSLIGSRIQLSGNTDAHVQRGKRRHMPRRFNVPNASRIKVLSAATDIFAAPDIMSLDGALPE